MSCLQCSAIYGHKPWCSLGQAPTMHRENTPLEKIIADGLQLNEWVSVPRFLFGVRLDAEAQALAIAARIDCSTVGESVILFTKKDACR
jgi:hypothetical protein